MCLFCAVAGSMVAYKIVSWSSSLDREEFAAAIDDAAAADEVKAALLADAVDAGVED